MKLNQGWIVKLMKVVIACLLAYCICQTVSNYRNELSWPVIDLSNFYLLILVILLMPLNWFIESKRWQFVMCHIGIPITTTKSFESTIVGLTMSLITPFKIGDYFGRMLLLRSNDKSSSLYATLLCSLYQNTLNVLFGIVGMYFLFDVNLGPEDKFLPFLFFNLLLLFFAFFLVIKIGRLLRYIQSSSWIKNIMSDIKIVDLSIKKSLLLLLSTLFRYIIYTFQYLLVLLFFGVDNSILLLLGGVSSIFLIQSAMPLPPILNILARTEIAILVWKIIGIHLSVALGATLLLWVINLMLPALLGLVLILYKWR